MIEKTLERIADALEKIAAAASKPRYDDMPAKDDPNPPGEIDVDLFGGPGDAPAPPPAVTLTDLQDAVRAAAGISKDKTIAVLGKYKAKRATEVDAAKYAACIEDLRKVK